MARVSPLTYKKNVAEAMASRAIASGAMASSALASQPMASRAVALAQSPWRSLVLLGLGLALMVAVSPRASAQAGEQVTPSVSQNIMQQKWVSDDSNLISTMVLVTLDPGASLPPHRHAGPAYVKVATGEVISQLEGGEEERFGPGDEWREPEGVRHVQLVNASDDTPAELIVVMIHTHGEPLTRVE